MVYGNWLIAVGVLALVLPAPAKADENINSQYVVVNQTIYPGEAIEVGDLMVLNHHRPIPLRHKIARDPNQVIGKVARKTILPKRSIQLHFLDSPSIVKTGQTVLVQLSAKSITLSLETEVLSDGGEGEKILVRNPDNKRIFCAVVVDARTAHLC